jgi:TatD DNase family protein
MLIDSHCHLDDFFKQNTLEALLKRARDHGVIRLINVGTSADDWSIHQTVSGRYSEIFYTVGLHPSCVEKNYETQLEKIQTFFQALTPPVALGEIGLDYHHLLRNEGSSVQLKKYQQNAFEVQLSIARELKCPVVIHSRNAFEDCVAMIDDSGVNWGQIVFHCFSYGISQMKILLDKGAKASFTGIITYKNAIEVQEALIYQGIERLMLETDAPFLTPVPHRGKTNEPAFVSYIAEKAAQLLKQPVSFVTEKTKQTTEVFFHLPPI